MTDCIFCGYVSSVECPVCNDPMCSDCFEGHKRLRCPQERSEFKSREEYDDWHRQWAWRLRLEREG